MSRETYSDFAFVETLPPDASARERQLQRADARSHTARISHRNKSRQQALGQRHTSPTGPPVSLPSLKPFSSRARPHAQIDHSSKDCIYNRTPCAQYIEESRVDKEVQLLVTDRDEDGRTDIIAYHPDDTTQRLLKYRKQPPKLKQGIDFLPLLYSGPASNTASFRRAREYVFNVAVPNDFPIFAIFDVTNTNSEKLFELCQQDHYRNVWIGLAHLLGSALSSSPFLRHEAWRHLGIALAQLRQRMASPDYPGNGALIPTVIFLGMIARASGDLEDARSHKTYLPILVEKMGGLDKLGFNGYIKACVLQWDSSCAINTGGQSIFACHRRTKPPVYPGYPLSAMLRNEIAGLPSGLRDMVYARVLPLDLIGILCRIASHLEPSRKEQLLKDVNVTWNPRRNSDFWEACSSLSIPGVDFNKFLCLALFLYIALEFSPIPSASRALALFSIPRAKLLAQLHLLESHISHPSQRECWIWMYMVLLDAWSENEKLIPSVEKVLLPQFLGAFPEITSWNTLEEVLRRFFWTEEFKRGCHSSWDALLLARGARDTRAATHPTTAPDSRLD